MDTPVKSEELNFTKHDKVYFKHSTKSGSVIPHSITSSSIRRKPTSGGILKGWRKRLHKLTTPNIHRLHARYASPGMLKVSAVKSFLEGIFNTRELAPKDDRDIFIRYTVREIAIYAVYLFLIGMMTLGVSSHKPFLLTETMTNLFVEKSLGPENPKNLQTSASVEDFWSYARNVIPNVLYSEYIYSKEWPVVVLQDPDKSGVLYENQLIGFPRLRQLRVKMDSCPVAANFRYFTRLCYPPYKEQYEDTGDKSNNNKWNDGGGKYSTAWQYKTANELNGSKHTAVLTTYSGGGSIILLSKNEKDTVEIIQNLYNFDWITRGTRAVFFDFTVYNANVNLFCIVRIVWEFPATGGVTTSWTFRTLRLIKYLTWFEVYVVFPCQILFCIFTIYYVIQEILEIKHLYNSSTEEYWKDYNNYLDWTIVFTSITCIGLTIYQYIKLSQTLEMLTLANELNEFYDFENVGYWETLLNQLTGFLVFFTWIKIFKYIPFNKTMIQLSATLSRCSQDIGGFAIMFFIVFFAFAQLGYLIFGSQVDLVRDFRTFSQSVFTLIRLIIGEFDFRRIESANRVLGPIFFLAYVFFIFFILLEWINSTPVLRKVFPIILGIINYWENSVEHRGSSLSIIQRNMLINMFLAIMTDTYSEVKAEVQIQRNEFEISDYIKRSFNNFIGLFGKRNVHKDAEDAVKLAPVDGHLSYDEIHKSLQRANYSDAHIKIFLSRFGLEPDGSLDEEDSQEILNNLGEENQNQENIKVTKGTEIVKKRAAVDEQFMRMQTRITNLEVGLTGLIHKIVYLTEKLRA